MTLESICIVFMTLCCVCMAVLTRSIYVVATTLLLNELKSLSKLHQIMIDCYAPHSFEIALVIVKVIQILLKN